MLELCCSLHLLLQGTGVALGGVLQQLAALQLDLEQAYSHLVLRYLLDYLHDSLRQLGYDLECLGAIAVLDELADLLQPQF